MAEKFLFTTNLPRQSADKLFALMGASLESLPLKHPMHLDCVVNPADKMESATIVITVETTFSEQGRADAEADLKSIFERSLNRISPLAPLP